MAPVKKRTELRVGIFVCTGLVLLGGLILQFGKFRERFKGHYQITVVFEDASGVIKGSDVRMGGAPIGKVSEQPKLNEAVNVEVVLNIDDEVRIPAGSKFQIESATLLGDKLITIDPADDKSLGFIAPGSRIDGGGPTGLEALQSNAERVIADVLRIVQNAEATVQHADQAVTDLRNASSDLRLAMAKVNESVLADANLKNIDTTLANLASSSERWNATSQKLDPTVEEARTAIESFRQAANDAKTTFHNADKAIQDLQPSLSKIPKAVDEFGSAMHETGGVMKGIRSGKGLLGALADDNDVALDVKTFMRNLKDYGILRYKNATPKAQGDATPEKSDKPKFAAPRR